MCFRKISIIIVTCIVVTGCPVPIYYERVPANVDTLYMKKDDLALVGVSPSYHPELVKDFKEEILGVDPSIQIIDTMEVWKTAFPTLTRDFEVSLLDLIQNDALDCLHSFGLNFVLSITPLETKKEEKGDFYFFVTHSKTEKSSEFMVRITKLGNRYGTGCIQGHAFGVTTGTWIFAPYIMALSFWVIKNTEHHVFKEVARMTVDYINANYESPPVRIVIIGSAD